jgi:hypothetical protein
MMGRHDNRSLTPGPAVATRARCNPYRDPRDGFAFNVRAFALLFKVIARKGVEDIRATAELIAKSDLEWTLVRIPNLKDGAAVGVIDTGWHGKTKLGMKLSRGNLAPKHARITP